MKRKILMMEPRPTSMMYKIIYFLRKSFDITLICLSQRYGKGLEEYKNLGTKVYSFNFQGERYLRDKKFLKGSNEVLRCLKLILKLRSRKWDFVLARTEPNHIGWFLFKFFPKVKKIYFPYDISFFRYGTNREKRTRGDIASERYCFKKADFIIHKGPKKELNLIREEETKKIKGKSISLLPYCFDKWIIPIKKKKDKLKGLHLVYIGGLFADDPDYYKIQIRDIFKTIAKQNVNVHVYSLDPTEKIPGKNICMHKPIPNIKLNEKIGEYHYGMMMCFYNQKKVDERWAKTTGSNKIFSYLEAGIPVIVNNEIEFIANLIRKYKCGIVISEKDLPNLKKILKKQNYSKLLKNVEKARNDLIISKNIKRFVNELN